MKIKLYGRNSIVVEDSPVGLWILSIFLVSSFMVVLFIGLIGLIQKVIIIGVIGFLASLPI